MAKGLMLDSIWFDQSEDDYVAAVVLVRECVDCLTVVIEPREGGGMAGVALSRDEWLELREFVEGEFRRSDERSADVVVVECETEIANVSIRK